MSLASDPAFLEKLARIITKLMPHQEQAISKFKKKPGLILYHGVGSGKTLTAIAAMDQLRLPTTIVAPAALIPNFKKEVAKHSRRSVRPKYFSTEMVARNPHLFEKTKGLLIVDEAHRLSNPGSKANIALKAAPFEKKLLLTGTPFINKPEDIESLKNIIEPARSSALKSFIDRFKTSVTSSDFPERIDESIPVPMSEEQEILYKDYLYSNFLYGGRIMPKNILQKMERGIPVNFSEKQNLRNFFLGNTRQVGNTLERFGAMDAPKVDKIVEDIMEGPGKTVAYSNYIASGIDPLTRKLEANGLRYGLFTGKQTAEEKEKAIQDYNKDKLDVLLVSSSGSEGLDLKGTKQIQIMEPHWNSAKIEQIIGRGIRYKSHEHLPPEERKVLVKKYYSVPKSGIGMDDYLRNLSIIKDRAIRSKHRLLRLDM